MSRAADLATHVLLGMFAIGTIAVAVWCAAVAAVDRWPHLIPDPHHRRRPHQ